MFNSQNYIEKPIHLVSINSFGKLVLQAQAINYLRSLSSPISILSIAGPYRTGKSFLLNSLISSDNQSNSFEVGHTINQTTHGLWIWGKPILANNNEGKITNIIVMDSEGFSSVQSTHDKRIVTLALLLSSCFLYNSKGPIDKDSLFDLQFVIEVARMINLQKNEKLSKNCDFHWILRDFHLELTNELGSKITSNEYMENCFLQAGQKINEKTIETLKQYFPNRKCHCLIRPQLDSNKQERPEFIQQVLELKKIMKNGIKSHNLSGEAFISIIQSYVQAINKGQDINEIFQQGYDCRVRLASLQKLNSKLKKLQTSSLNNLPKKEEQLDDKLVEIRSQIKQYYKQRMCSNKQIQVLDQDVEEIIQEFQAQHTSKYLSSKHVSQKYRQGHLLETPSNYQRNIRVSLQCSQVDEKSEFQQPYYKINKNHQHIIKSDKVDKNLLLKIQQLQLKLHRFQLEGRIFEQQNQSLKSQVIQLKNTVGFKQDEISQGTQNHLNSQKHYHSQIQKLNDKLTALEQSHKFLLAEKEKIELLANEKIQFLSKSLLQSSQTSQKQSNANKIKYKLKIKQLTEQLAYCKKRNEQELQQIKQIYIKKQQHQKTILRQQLSQEEQGIYQQLELKTSQIQQLKIENEQYKIQIENLKQEIKLVEFKYVQKQLSLKDQLQQQLKRVSEIETNMGQIYGIKLQTKQTYISELQEKIRALNLALEREIENQIQKVNRLQQNFGDDKEELLNINNELRNSCLEAIRRVSYLKEEAEQKDKIILEQQNNKHNLLNKYHSLQQQSSSQISRLKQLQKVQRKQALLRAQQFETKLRQHERSTETLQKQLRILQTDYDNLLKEHEVLEEDKAELQENYDLLMDNYKELEADYHSSAQASQGKQDQLIRLREAVDIQDLRHRKQLNNLTSLIKQKQQNLSQLSQKAAQFSTKSEQLKDKLSQQSHAHEQEIRKVTNICQQLKIEITFNKQQLQKVRQQKSQEVQRTRTEWQGQRNKLLGQHQNLQTIEKAVADSFKLTLQTQIVELKTCKSVISQQLEQNIQLVQDYLLKQSSYQNELRSYQQQLATQHRDFSQQLSKLNDAQHSLKEEVHLKDQDLKQRETQLSKVKCEVIVMINDIDILHNKLAEVKGQLDRLDHQLEQKSQQCQQKGLVLTVQRQNNEKFQHDYASLALSCQQLKTQLSQLKQAYNQQQTITKELKELSNEYKESSSQNAILLAQQSQKLTVLSSQNDDLQTEIDCLTEEIKKLKKLLAIYQADQAVNLQNYQHLQSLHEQLEIKYHNHLQLYHSKLESSKSQASLLAIQQQSTSQQLNKLKSIYETNLKLTQQKLAFIDPQEQKRNVFKTVKPTGDLYHS